MSTPPFYRPPTTAVLVQNLLGLWVLCLSVFVILSYQAMNAHADSDQTDQKRLDTRMQRLEAQVAGLTDITQVLHQQPAAATAAGSQNARQAMEARLTQIEQALSGHAVVEDLQTLRTEVEQIKANQRPVSVPPPTPSKPAVYKLKPKPKPLPLPFRIIGAELRAGQRSVSVAPRMGDFTPDQLQVLLPGDAVGSWRLLTVEGGTAVFQAGKQTRRVVIP